MPVIEGKPLEQSEYGLLGNASEVITATDHRWEGGFHHPVTDADVQLRNIIQRVIGGGAEFEDSVYESNTRTPSYLEYTPFFVESRLEGSTFEPDTESKKERVVTNLEIGQQKSIEQEVWTGVLSKFLDSDSRSNTSEVVKNRFLTDTSDSRFVSLSSTAVEASEGLGLLEEALGEQTIGYAPVIYAPKRIAHKAGIAPNDDKGFLVTPLGTPAIAGAGFTKIGSDYWLVGTGPMTIVLGTIDVFSQDLTQAVNTKNNTIEYVAQRPVGVFWTTEKVFGIKVDPSIKP